MSVTIKLVALCPRHHIGIGIREQQYTIALFVQALQSVEVTLRQSFGITLPSIFTLFVSHFITYQLREFAAEVFCRNLSFLQIAEDATLLIGVKAFFGIRQT